MEPDEFNSLLERAGIHGFAIEMSLTDYHRSLQNDLWVRFFIIGFAFLALVALAFAWRNQVKSSALQLRLVRAGEMNIHLREMNLAAAGLAHETRNPLNLVRGLAQLIAKEPSVDSKIHDQAWSITEEVDRVTAQLNEFIDYSKPREPHLSPILLEPTIQDVIRTLQTDLEDKNIKISVDAPEITILADETLLRQVIFNLLINSIQSVESQGEIQIDAVQNGKLSATLNIRDNGPGITLENQDKIFRPYFTTRENGTGLGLAVVKQIILAHRWEIDYQSNQPSGAWFRLSGLALFQE